MFFKEQLLSSSQYNVEKTSNKLFAWGLNTSGQVGTVLYIYSIAQLSSGLSHTVALTSDNRLLIWGLNSSGQLGIGDTLNRSFPVQIGSTGWKKVSAGSSFTVAVRADGALFTWGNNASGQIGDGSIVSKSSPVQIGSFVSWLNVSAGQDYALATTNSLSLYGWGLNTSGQLGDNLAISRSTPIQINSNPSLADGSSNNLVFVSGGTLNSSIVPFNNIPAGPATNGTSNELNLSISAPNATPQQITTGSIAGFNVGGFTNYTIECWIYLTALNNAQIYSLGTGFAVAWTNFGLTSSGTVYWQFGNGSWGWAGNITSATGAVVINTWYHLAFVKQGTACVIYRDGTSIASGNLTISSGQSGTLFIGSYYNNVNGDGSYLRGYISNFRMVSGTAVYTGTFTPPTSPLTAISGTQVLLSQLITIATPSFVQLSAGNTTSYGIDTSGLLYSWGVNNAGQLGLNVTSASRIYINQVGTSSWNLVSAGTSHASAIRVDGTLWAWGLNNAGQLGINNTINRSSPVQVGVDSWKQISAGTSFTLGIASTNLLYGWGLNNSGQIGLVTSTVSRSAPIQITTGSWSLISAGGLFATATNDTKLLYNWGSGAGGTQADGITINRSSPVLVSFSQTISQSSPVQIGADSWAFISSGNNFFIARRSDNLLYGWGNNLNGQLGDNSAITKSSPVQIGTSSWIAVSAQGGAAGLNTVLAIRSDNSLWGWGLNSVGLKNTVTSWIQITTGVEHSVALRSDNTVWCWGQGLFGALGNNSTISRSSPVQAGSANNWTMVTTTQNQSSGAINSLGELYMWGNNQSGDLAINVAGNRSNPTIVPFNTLSWTFVAGTGGITNDSKLWKWGVNSTGAIGDNTTIDKSSPVHVGVGTSFTFVTGHLAFTGAIDTTGKLWTWGLNTSGSLGINDAIDRSRPVLVSTPVQIQSISWSVVAATDPHMLGLTTTGLLYAWGRNNEGQLGDGTTISKSTPVQIGASLWAAIGVTSSASQAIDLRGALFTWGSGANGRLGDGQTAVSRSSPVQITGGGNFGYSKNNFRVLASNRAGSGRGGILRSDGAVYMWGDPTGGALGNNLPLTNTSVPALITTTLSSVSSPVLISSSTSWTQVTLGFNTAAAINNLGELYTWGSDNQFGTLGDDTTINTLSPSKLGSSSWTQASAGNYHVLAITSNRRMFAWGLNTVFRLGDNTSVNKSSPVQIGVGSSWNAASAGNNHSLAIRLDGSLFAWGQNDAGQLGIIIEPQSWTQISTGESAALAIRADGLLYGWGLNTSGQLGDGTVGTKSSPTQIGTSSWTQVSSNFSNTVAIRSDGTLWSWGAGNILLGDGTVIAKSSPVQIGNSSWSQVSVGFSHVLAIDALGRLYGWGIATALNASTVAFSWTTVSENNSHVAAIRSDGLLFVWGLNSSGQVGNNNVVSQSSPIQIGTSSWISVGAGFDHTLAVTSDYRLFAWGNNTRYQIGDNTSINKSSPVQIGTGTSWTQVTAGTSYSMAITTNGELYGWGLGASGQTGALTQPRIWNNVDAGFSTSAAVRSDNVLFVWGLNSSGQVGDATVISRSSPVQVPTTPVVSPIPASWNAVSTGFDHTLGITRTGALYGWGNPVTGATGNFGEIYSWTLVSGSGTNWYGIRSDGSLWSSGTNSLGQLGLNDTVVRSSPTQVGTSSWLFVNSGGGTNANAVFGITSDYRLFAWGNNGSGQLGTNDIITRSSPTLIDAGIPYAFVTTGAQTLAIRTNGTLWATGVNTTGQLGTNDIITRSNLVQVGTSTWTKVAAADGHTLAIRSDATLWSWGTAGTNQLGNNSTVNRSSPVQVTSPGASPWIDIAGGFLYSVGITGAGLGTPYSAYVWGGNNSGATGLNTTVGNNALPTLMKAGAAGNSFVQVTTNWGGGSTPNTFIRSNNGQIWGMGSGFLIGDNTFAISRSSPVLVAGSTSWSQLPVTAQADGVMCAIATNNTLWGWDLVPSYLTYAGSGVIRVSAPVQVGGNIRWGTYTFPLYSILSEPGQGSWTAVEAGQSFSFGIKNNKLYGWGLNSSGQTGTNISTNPILSPVQIGNSSWSLVSASVGGNFAGGIDSSNRLFMWGSGVAQTALQYSNVAPQWNQITVGLSHTIGLRSDGTLWSWGGNAGGQLGDGTTINKSSPVQIGTSSWIQVATGYGSSYAIRRDGTLWSWGINDFGTLGISPLIGNRSSPTQIGTSSWSLVAAGYYSAYGILPNNQLFCWGDNSVGQLGTTDIVIRSSPTLISGGGTYRYVSSSGRLTAAIRTDNTLWMFGYGTSGGIGNGSSTSQATPQQVTTGSSTWTKVVIFGTIGASEQLITGVAGITTAGTLYTWGAFANGAAASYRGQIAVPTITLFGTTTSFTNITSGIAGVLFATDTNNNLWAWGANDFGQLGNSDAPVTNRSSPVILASTSGTSWRLLNNMSNGYNGSLVNSNLDLYIWGNNANGQLGIGDTINRSSPVQLAGNWVQTNNIYTLDWLLPILSTTTSSPVQIGTSSWNVVSAGGSHTLAVRNDNTLWGWGINTNYQLGLGNDTITRSSPTQIGTSSWSVVSAGFDHSMAIRSDGTLWGWGNNIVGQVGTFIQPNSWTSVVTRGQSTIGIRLDGSLYAWGVGTSGQLGDNSVISKSSPVLIDSGSWIFATTNVYHSAAIKSDGTLWLWGNNSQGQLGQNDVISRSSPVQVIGGGSWTQVALGNFYTVGLKVGGTAFAWGWNSQGFVGDGTTINKSSPVQCTGGQIFTQIESTQGSHNNNPWGQIFGINNSGILYTWGANNGGISGGGTGAPARSNPTIFNSNNPWNITTWSRVFAGEGWAYGIRTDGALYVWGQGRIELSVQNTAGFGSWTSPVPIDAGQSYALVAAAGSDTTAVFGVRSNGALYTSGWNNFGTQFTLSTASVRSNFTLIDAGPFTNISFNMDETVVAFKSSNPNIPFYWGRGTGSAGIGYLINRSSPTQIGNNPNINTISPVQVATGSWSQVSAGYQYTLAEDVNSNIYAWGQDSSGQLGL